jgi:hemolysin activation/secretion protein
MEQYKQIIGYFPLKHFSNANLLWQGVILILLSPPLCLAAENSHRETTAAPLSTLAHVWVSRFRFEGNHSYSESELADLLKSYTNRYLSAEVLQEAKNKITQHYINDGYINSGAIIPDQKVHEGEILLKIIEGTLTRVEITGNEHVKTEYIKRRIEDDQKTTLNINELQKRLQLLQQNTLFKRLNAELSPSVNLGESILHVKTEEAHATQWGLRFNNHRSPSIGAYRMELEGTNRNVTGWGDSLAARYGLTKGLNDYALDYSLPINRYDTTLAFHIGRSDSKVVEEAFRQLDVKSLVDSYEASISHPWYKTPDTEFHIGLKFDHRHSETFLLGKPFSFSPGIRDGLSRISVLRFSQNWLSRSRTQVFAAHSSFNFGLHTFNATINRDGSPDGRFFNWLGQAQWIRRLPIWDSQMMLRADIQLSKNELLPLEKFALGGASSVRGYRENQLIRDNGLLFSWEWRIPISAWRNENLLINPETGALQLVPFVDYGRAWNTQAATPDPHFLASIGLGLRWTPITKMTTELYWGKALKSISGNKEHDLQDNGLHFEVYTQW